MPLRRNVSVGADRKIIAAILMTSSALASVAGTSGAFAQPLVSSAMTADQSKSFSIPAGSLAKTLTSFGAQSGKQVSVETSVIQGLSSPGVAGLMTAQQALTQLLAGTGLTYRLSGNVVTLVKASANITLGPVRVGGTLNRESATGPGVGYVAHYTASGSKTDTPLTEIPNSIYVVTKQQIQDQQPQNIMEALRYTPGVYTDQYGTGDNGSMAINGTGAGTSGSILMRGFNASQFVDGLNTRSYSAGETAFVERIEAVNGPASVLYGQVGAGGLVATSLKKPTDTAIHNVSVGFGNWGRYEATFDVGDNLTKSGNLQYRVAAIGVTQGSQTDYLHYKRLGILPSIKWKIDKKTNLTLIGSYLYTPNDGINWTGYPLKGTLISNNGRYIPRSRFLGDPNVNESSATTAEFEYQFDHAFNNYFSFHQVFRYSKSEDNMNQYYKDFLSTDGNTLYRNSWASQNENENIGLDSRFIGHIPTGPVNQTLVAGMDFRKISVSQPLTYDDNDFPIDIWNPNYGGIGPNYSLTGPDMTDISNTKSNYFQKGIYFQDQIKFGRLSVILGGRQDWASASTNTYAGGGNGDGTYTAVHYTKTRGYSASKFTWRAGFTYNFKFGLTPYFSYATSFLPQEGSYDFSGKPIAPLQGGQFEAGLKYYIPQTDVFLTAAAYHIKENHYQTTDPEHPNYSIDAGTVVSKGIELSAHANITHDLHLIASYSFTDARVTKSNTSEPSYDVYGNLLGNVPEKGKYLRSVPRNMANLFFDYTLSKTQFRGLGLNFGVRYTGFTYSSDANSIKVPAYTVFDIGAHYDFGNTSAALKGLRAQLAISNLTNERYLTSCYGKASCSYGQGRRVYGNLSYSW
ncbi:TonB-dependent siderophore receptor [Gluconacetobacter sp. 1c LMG 22058]|uniref:TonB-dependent siderophore receptor n=1 Tax=Gluconacetobacter dulcium TaxID=2729096 RepID=A0A7W4K261_9PROT|nr:TonB-dependent siderophore receptor [Gluconacetobacter dulcium]